MANLIYDEMTLFGICLVLGAGLTFIYDVIRILRILIRHADVVVDIEDLMFWIFTAWMVFRTLVVYNSGTLRAYAFFGIFLGVIIYALTFSRLLLYIFRRLAPYWNKCFKILLKPFILLGHSMRKTLKNIAAEVKIAFKGR